ncbi:MAG: hypothetical protein K2X09_04890 [Rickettsiales bacterium]|nr:hypothetical protein [Rickettsiales bacterium]
MAGKGSHASWRNDFLDALEVPLRPEHEKTFPLYQFSEADSLPVLVGQLLAAEMSIPAEDTLVLRAMRHRLPHLFSEAAHPEKATEAQKKATLYLADHIRHDAVSHFPELMEAIAHDLPSPDEQAKVKAGIESFTAERKGLFDHIQQVVGYDTPAIERGGVSAA